MAVTARTRSIIRHSCCTAPGMDMRRVLAVFIALVLSGCVSTVKTVVTAPFKVAGQAADWATTSQDESDRNRGRQIRKAEEKARKACRHEVEGDYARENCVRQKLREQGIT